MDNKDNVIKVNFGSKSEEHEDGMFIDEFMELVEGEVPNIILESYSCDYEDIIFMELNISLKDYYENVAEEKYCLEKIVEMEDGAEWHYINNENGLLKIDDFYKIKEQIEERFSDLELYRVFEIKDFIILVYKEKEFADEESISIEETDCLFTMEEFQEYYNDEIFYSLSKERQEYLISLFGDKDS